VLPTRLARMEPVTEVRSGDNGVEPDSLRLSISVDLVGGRTIVTVTGELDLASVHAFSDALRRARAAGGQRIGIDARDLTFVDSAGLQALVVERRTTIAAGGSFALLHMSPALERMLELSGLAEIFVDPDAT
jgi:anti-sigma B factor antagonist